MKIEINRCLEGAKIADGITVVIDVFRASNTILACLAGGNQSIEPATEDEECVRYLKAQLEDEHIDMDQIRKSILDSDGANRLRRLGQEEDLEFCLKLNTY